MGRVPADRLQMRSLFSTCVVLPLQKVTTMAQWVTKEIAGFENFYC